MVEFSLRQLIVEGQLAGVRPGDSRDRVRELLGVPGDWGAGKRVDVAGIWRYGNFEVHFDGAVAWMLFTDYLDALDAGPGRRLDSWFVTPGNVPSPAAVLEHLRAEQIPFVIERDVLDRRVVRIDGGACLAFGSDEDCEDSPESWFAIEVKRPG